MSGCKSPSKFTRLDALIQIKQDHYMGSNGDNYEESEVDELIIIKQSKLDEENNKRILKEVDKAPPKISEKMLQESGDLPPKIPASIKRIPIIEKRIDFVLKDQMINQILGVPF